MGGRQSVFHFWEPFSCLHPKKHNLIQQNLVHTQKRMKPRYSTVSWVGETENCQAARGTSRCPYLSMSSCSSNSVKSFLPQLGTEFLPVGANPKDLAAMMYIAWFWQHILTNAKIEDNTYEKLDVQRSNINLMYSTYQPILCNLC